MRKIVPSKKFDKDIKRCKRRNKDLSKISKIVNLLQKDGQLSSRFKPHPLTGNWKPMWDCHIEPDWILIYQITNTHIFLVRTGTHSDLFKS